MSAARLKMKSLALLSVVVAAALGAGCNGAASEHVGTQADGGVTATTDCKSCHMPEYRSVRNPVHVGAKPTTCEVCHSQDAWRPSVVHHEWWPLTGAHEKAECAFCHTGTPPVFDGTPKACVGCHREDFGKSKFPGHANFATTCADCHSTTKWKPATHKPTPEPPPPEAAVIDAGAPAAKPPPTAHPKPRPTATAAPTTPTPPATPTTPPTPAPDVTTKASKRR